MIEPAASLAKVKKRFTSGGKTRTVLDGADLGVSIGEMVSIVGPSGAGKTTILNLVSGIDAEYEGEVRLLGQALAALDDDARTLLRGRSVGFVFQSFQLLEHLSVGENVSLPLWLSGPVQGGEDARIDEVLQAVGLDGRRTEPVGPLSGGERQRVAIARAVVHRPKLVLADEPTGNLDAATAESIYGIFERLKREGTAVLIATHDKNLAARADRVVRLAGGRLEEVAA